MPTVLEATDTMDATTLQRGSMAPICLDDMDGEAVGAASPTAAPSTPQRKVKPTGLASPAGHKVKVKKISKESLVQEREGLEKPLEEAMEVVVGEDEDDLELVRAYHPPAQEPHPPAAAMPRGGSDVIMFLRARCAQGFKEFATRQGPSAAACRTSNRKQTLSSFGRGLRNTSDNCTSASRSSASSAATPRLARGIEEVGGADHTCAHHDLEAEGALEW